MSFYKRIGVFKKQVLSDEKLMIAMKIPKPVLEVYSKIYGIDSVEEAIRFVMENEKDFTDVYEMGRYIKNIGFKDDVFEYYCRAYV